MTDIKTLRPEVQAAMRTMNGQAGGNRDDAYDVIEAELLRLADECATLKARSIYPRAQLLANFAAANERAEKAEAELAALKAKIKL